MNRQLYYNYIDENLAILSNRIRQRAKTNILDLNIHCENFFCSFLNILFNYKLQNINLNDNNSSAIDLVDSKNKIIFQVTSTASKQKIQNTLDKKVLKEYEGYNIKFLFISDPEQNLRKKSYQVPYGIKFDSQEDIYDVSSLLHQVSNQDIDTLKKIYELFQKEFNNTNLSKSKQHDEQKCFRERMLSKALWKHETTDDNRYVPRLELLQKMDDWINTEDVRIISIRGIGGTGKTSLVGYWLKTYQSECKRPLNGIFYWSFYAERDCSLFLKDLYLYFENIQGVDLPPLKEKSDFMRLFQEQFYNFPPILVVLDGLEVLQEDLNQSSHGSFIDSIIRDFILQIVSSGKQFICITTSRFVLKDIVNKKQVKECNIYGVTENQGENILRNHGVCGEIKERKEVSSFLEGHPLALKIFAASANNHGKLNDPKLHHFELFGGLKPTLFGEKLSRLLDFYKVGMPEIQLSLIVSLSMFRKAIYLNTWLALSEVFYESKSHSNDLDNLVFKQSIGQLIEIGLVIKDQINTENVFACHPIIRDYFNSFAFSNDTASSEKVAKFLISSPDSFSITGVKEVEKYKVAIEILLKVDNEYDAIELYKTRMRRGNIFLALGLPKEAKELYSCFIDYYERKKYKTKNLLQENINANYINPYIEFCIQLGEFEEAEIRIEQSLSKRPIAACYRWLATINFQKGNFAETIRYCEKAIDIDNSRMTDNSRNESLLLTYYLLYKSKIYADLNPDSTGKKVNEIVKNIPNYKFSDFKARKMLCKLLFAISNNNKPLIKQFIFKLDSNIGSIRDWYFALEVKLVEAEAFIVLNRLFDAENLVEAVYKKSVNESYPFTLYQSILLREKIYYFRKDEIRVGNLLNLLEQVKSNQMIFLALKIINFILSSKSLDAKIREDLLDQKSLYSNCIGII